MAIIRTGFVVWLLSEQVFDDNQGGFVVWLLSEQVFDDNQGGFVVWLLSEQVFDDDQGGFRCSVITLRVTFVPKPAPTTRQ